jgi:hypothetical protein
VIPQEGNAYWKGTGFSGPRVPSLSKRAEIVTKTADPSFANFSTKEASPHYQSIEAIVLR